MTYEELVEVARADDAIVGLVLTGSRARGHAVTDEADWDVRLVVRDDVVDDYQARHATQHGPPTEVVVLSLSEFEEVEVLARRHGLGDVIDGWEPDVAWLRGD